MFTSLEVAKKCGAISFEWTETSVVVFGLPHIMALPECLAVCLAETKEGDEYRAEIEHMLAAELGIVPDVSAATWIPEEFRP